MTLVDILDEKRGAIAFWWMRKVVVAGQTASLGPAG
jgi:hypothetical protein